MPAVAVAMPPVGTLMPVFVALLLALSWGALAAAPLVVVRGRVVARDRARSLRQSVAPMAQARAPRWRRVRLRPPAALTRLARLVAEPLRRRRSTVAEQGARRDLPIAIELVAVAVGAGCTPYAAVELAARWSEGVPQVALCGLVERVRVGASFDEALGATAADHAVVRPLLTALRRSAELGTPASAALARLAAEVRAEVRRHAEARARTVPVRLLFPLVLCVLPASRC